MVAYTIDGGGRGTIDVETFSADGATVRFIGHNIHPSIGKGRMVNAVRAASDFVAALPRDQQTPETTELILRSFESDDLESYADQIRSVADQVAKQTPGIHVEVEIRRQYRNMRDGLVDFPEAVSLAEQAFANLGRPCKREIIRGGTDGSQLTEKGLPTPNLSSGQHNIHAVTEFACLDEMVEATEHLVEMLKLWSEHRV
jgi:tripeptide aminopeptidase